MALQDPPEAEEVLNFWYGPLSSRADDNYEHRYTLWFGRGSDSEITSRFSATIAKVGASEELRQIWCQNPRGTVAYIVLLDQLNRNVHRGTSSMFCHDKKCVEEARRLIAERRHVDGSLTAPEISHVLICLTHSETRSDHDHIVPTAYNKLLDVLSETQCRHFKGHAHMATMHALEIRRFGRYPHRNKLLGRESSPAELDWLVKSAETGYHKQVNK